MDGDTKKLKNPTLLVGGSTKRTRAQLAYDIETKTRMCRYCGDRLPFDNFWKRKESPDGCKNICKECDKRRKEVYYIENRQEINETNRKYNYKSRYGISIKDYNKMLKEQGYHCAICGMKEDKRRLSIDHDHNTGTVRALLCSGCNKGLGLFMDSYELLNKASSYLRRFNGEVN